MISKTSEYALQAVIHLAAHHGSNRRVPQIAKATHIPQSYLSKIMGDLARGGIVLSSRGKAGGFSLANDPSEITMLDVVNAVDPLIRIEACPLDNQAHAEQLCPLHSTMDSILARAESKYKGRTIASLISEEAKCEHYSDVIRRA